MVQCDQVGGRGSCESITIFVFLVMLVTGTLYAAFGVNDYSGDGPNADVQFTLLRDPFSIPTLQLHQNACRYTMLNNMSVPIKIRARTCDGHQHGITCALEKRRKLLVLYMHTNSKEYSIETEYDNMRLFLANAVLAPNTTTKLYSSVDYVFTRISEEVDVPTIVAHPRHNVWFVHVAEKGTPCDLCAHGLVVKLLRINLLADYDSVLYMNSGARGPYIHSDEHWMDIVTMAGNPLLPLLPDGSVDHKYRPVTGASHLWIIQGFPGFMESWFVLAPRTAFGIITELWKEACADGFGHCIMEAEMKLRERVEGELGMSTYALCQGVLLDVASDITMIAKAFNNIWRTTVVDRWSEPCKCIFIKFGGSSFREKQLRAQYVDRVQKMQITHTLHSLAVLYTPVLVPPVEWILG